MVQNNHENTDYQWRIISFFSSNLTITKALFKKKKKKKKSYLYKNDKENNECVTNGPLVINIYIYTVYIGPFIDNRL